MSRTDRPRPPKDRSRHATLFERLHDPIHWDQWHAVGVVRGGGLRDRLEKDKYVGLRGLDYETTSTREEDGRQTVWIRIKGER